MATEADRPGRVTASAPADLNLWYGDFQALKDVDVNIQPGVHHRR